MKETRIASGALEKKNFAESTRSLPPRAAKKESTDATSESDEASGRTRNAAPRPSRPPPNAVWSSDVNKFRDVVLSTNLKIAHLMREDNGKADTLYQRCIAEWWQRYEAVAHCHKRQTARQCIEDMHARGVRFLVRDPDMKRNVKWYEQEPINSVKISNKVLRALRQEVLDQTAHLTASERTQRDQIFKEAREAKRRLEQSYNSSRGLVLTHGDLMERMVSTVPVSVMLTDGTTAEVNPEDAQLIVGEAQAAADRAKALEEQAISKQVQQAIAEQSQKALARNQSLAISVGQSPQAIEEQAQKALARNQSLAMPAAALSPRAIAAPQSPQAMASPQSPLAMPAAAPQPSRAMAAPQSPQAMASPQPPRAMAAPQSPQPVAAQRVPQAIAAPQSPQPIGAQRVPQAIAAPPPKSPVRTAPEPVKAPAPRPAPKAPVAVPRLPPGRRGGGSVRGATIVIPANITTKTLTVPLPIFLDLRRRFSVGRTELEKEFLNKFRALHEFTFDRREWVGFTFRCRETMPYNLIVSGRVKVVDMVLEELETWLQDRVMRHNWEALQKHGTTVDVEISAALPVGATLCLPTFDTEFPCLTGINARGQLQKILSRKFVTASTPFAIIEAIEGIQCRSIELFKALKNCASLDRGQKTVSVQLRLMPLRRSHVMCSAPPRLQPTPPRIQPYQRIQPAPSTLAPLVNVPMRAPILPPMSPNARGTQQPRKYQRTGGKAEPNSKNRNPVIATDPNLVAIMPKPNGVKAPTTAAASATTKRVRIDPKTTGEKVAITTNPSAAASPSGNNGKRVRIDPKTNGEKVVVNANPSAAASPSGNNGKRVSIDPKTTDEKVAINANSSAASSSGNNERVRIDPKTNGEKVAINANPSAAASPSGDNGGGSASGLSSAEQKSAGASASRVVVDPKQVQNSTMSEQPVNKSTGAAAPNPVTIEKTSVENKIHTPSKPSLASSSNGNNGATGAAHAPKIC